MEDQLIGKTLWGKYTVEAYLGEDQISRVYKVLDIENHDCLVMKLLRADLAQDSQFLRQLEDDLQILAKLDHPNIVHSYGLKQDGDQVFLLTDYIEGTSLCDEISAAGRPLKPQRIMDIMEQVCSALHTIHGMNLLHGGIRPANIITQQNGTVLVTGLGFTRQADRAGVGMPAYMAPEQVQGMELTPATDIYALGIVLYEMLTGGNHPFTGKKTDLPDWLDEKVRREQVHLKPPPLSSFIPTISPQVEKVVMCCLEKDPALRYAGSWALLHGLSLALGIETGQLPVHIEELETVKGSSTERQGDRVCPVCGELYDASLSDCPYDHTQVLTNRVPVLNETEQEATLIRDEQIKKGSNSTGIACLVGGVLILLFFSIVCFLGYFTVTQWKGDWKEELASWVNGKPTATMLPSVMVTPSKTSQHTPTLTSTPSEIDSQQNTESPEPDIGSTITSEIDGMQMVFVPAGEFIMGSTDADDEAYDDEKPQHSVYLDAYWIDKTEVTNAMFAEFVADTGYETDAEKDGYAMFLDGEIDGEGIDWRHPNGSDDNIDGMDEYPVMMVSWNDASAYCEWAGRHLPTEAQWEKAARGTDGRIYPWGNQPPTGSEANFADSNFDIMDWSDRNVDDGYKFTAPVGSYPAGASPYGALDMAGNLLELVNDWYSQDYYSRSPENNPQGPPSGLNHIIRGGTWSFPSKDMRSAWRGNASPDLRSGYQGFRCAIGAAEQYEVTQEASAMDNQPEEVKDGQPSVTREPVIGSTMTSEIDDMELVYVPAGEFLMGLNDVDGGIFGDEIPQHSVYLDAYWIDRTEVTNTMFARFIAETGYQTQAEVKGLGIILDDYDLIETDGVDWQHPLGNDSSNDGLEEYPVVQVSWYDAAAYCEWAGRRLPTEAEWEKAARGTDGRTYPWGNQGPAGNLLNYADVQLDEDWADISEDDGYQNSAPVGSYPEGVSPYGALDMAGNVGEWTNDWHGKDYYSQSPADNPTGPLSGVFRVIRGGSWYREAVYSRTFLRNNNGPDFGYPIVGFRCVYSAPEQRAENRTEAQDASVMDNQREAVEEEQPSVTREPDIGSTMTTDIDGMEMVYVPQGEFLMGAAGFETLAKDREKPMHRVTLDAYWIDRTEVTNAMFARFVADTGYQTQAEILGSGWVRGASEWVETDGADWRHPQGNNSIDGLDDYPVVQVSWYDAAAYCEWAGKRLPTEAEWEKAARSTDGRVYPWGNMVPDINLLNSDNVESDGDWTDKSDPDGYKYTSPAGNYPEGASPYGALDMAGNVWEWVNDWFGENYYSQSPSNNPPGPPSGECRVARGGSWCEYALDARTDFRAYYSASYSLENQGFRCALSAVSQ